MDHEFCTHCGEPLVPGDDFCGSCGWPIGGKDVPDPTTSAPEPGAPPAAASSKPGYVGGGNKGPWIVGGAIVLVIVLVVGYLLFFNGDGSPTPEPTVTDTVTATSTATASPKPADLKPADARLRENFALTMTGTSSNVPGVKGDVFKTVWHFDPKCADGPCDTVVVKPHVDLTRNEANYKGEASDAYGSTCNGDAVSAYIEVNLKVQDAAMRENKWAATKLIGKLHMKISQQGGCDEADATYKIHGKITQKSAAPGTGVPAIAQTSYPQLNSASSAANYFFDAWNADNRGEAEWSGTDAAVTFIFGVKKKAYQLRCGGLGYLGGKNCGLYLHKQEFPAVIFKMASGGESGWYVNQAYYNAE